MPTAERGGFFTHWTVQGDGDRDALLVHCSLAHQGAWAGVVAGLTPSLRMTAFDLPGHGRSADWDGRGDYQGVAVSMAADLVEHQADLIGHSFGATVALRLAIEQPQKVRSLILIEPVFFAVSRKNTSPSVNKHRAEYQEVVDALDCGDTDKAASLFIGAWGDGVPWPLQPGSQRAYAIARIQQIREIEPELYDDRAGLIDRLGKLNLPVLILDGTRSPAIMSVVCDELQSRIPGATRHRIEGAGHLLPITHPAAVALSIAEFLKLGPIRQ